MLQTTDFSYHLSQVSARCKKRVLFIIDALHLAFLESMTQKRVFPGRVIFDHLPKTAGQAINAWLTEVLGYGCVTPNLNGSHRQLIRQYGGQYSIISGHIQFRSSDGLDPRYQYTTLLRDPVDRVVSWLYFVISNHDDGQFNELRSSVTAFVDSDGREVPEILIGSIRNVYVEHFGKILGNGLEADSIRLQNSLAAIRQYDLVGIYERLPEYVSGLAELIGVQAPHSLLEVNVTKQRPKISQISEALRQKIAGLNSLDIELYNAILPKATQAVHTDQDKKSQWPVWSKYEPLFDRVLITPYARIVSATLREGNEVRRGQLITFDVVFFLSNATSKLEMGIHIFDGNRAWVFGVNSSMLGHSYEELAYGFYRASYHLVADMPSGSYTAGFALADLCAEGNRELAWHDVMCGFQVLPKVDRKFAGSVYLPAEISLSPVAAPERLSYLASDERIGTSVGRKENGKILSCGTAGCLVSGPYAQLLAGSCVARIVGRTIEAVAIEAKIDVAANMGQLILHDKIVSCSGKGDFCFEIPFKLSRSFADIEIRLWIAEGAIIEIHSIEIECGHAIEHIGAAIAIDELFA